MSSPIADGVMAATHKLVQQAMSGQWQDVPKTIEERRVLLGQLDAATSAQDRPWLDALKQAMAESDAAVAKITELSKAEQAGHKGLEAAGAEGHNATRPGSEGELFGAAVSTMEWLNRAR